MPKGLKIELSEQTKIIKVKYADSPSTIPHEITVEELNKKISQPFTYSNALFSKGEHPSYYKQGYKTEYLDYPFKKFQEFGFTDTSSFIICNMGAVGHGVFAARDFEPTECFILYAGIIADKSSEKDGSIYSFSYDSSISLYVDAAETGNISRFIQHMPENYNLFSQYRYTVLKDDKNQIQKDKKLSDYWQWRNLEYKSNLTETDVAWANLTFMVIPIQGVPCAVLFNTKKINKGDQLGISYGHYYWLGRNLKPELFDLKGRVIPATEYGYKEIVIQLPLMELFNRLPMFKQNCFEKSYTALAFKKDLEREQQSIHPVWFSHLCEPVSIFKLRESLLYYNVIGPEFAPIENEFTLNLRNLLPKEFVVKMYERTPHQQSKRGVYDIVCYTDDLIKWSQFTLLLKNPMHYVFKNLCLKVTQEVILLDITNNLEAQQLLLMALLMAQKNGFFKNPLPKELIPIGPTRKDPTILQKVVTEQDFNQVIFHNPGLTKAAIEEIYDLVENAFDPLKQASSGSQNIGDKEKKLNALTFSFFKPGSTHSDRSWKAYPADLLTKEFFGHELRFFNFRDGNSEQAKQLFNVLKRSGFAAELKKLKNNRPSILVDLTTSILKL